MGNACFRFLRDKVEDRCAGRLGAGAGGRGNGDERLERFGDGQSTTQRRIDEIEEVGVGETDVEVHELGGIDDAAATDCEEGVGLVGFRKGDCFFDAAFPSDDHPLTVPKRSRGNLRAVFRLHFSLVENCEFNPLPT